MHRGFMGRLLKAAGAAAPTALWSPPPRRCRPTVLSIPPQGVPPALSVKPDNLTLQGVNEKVKGLGQRAHLTQLLLWVAPVWSAQLLQRLGLADFHRTDRQRLYLQRKQGELVTSCSNLLNATTNQCCTLGGSVFVVTFRHEGHKIQS